MNLPEERIEKAVSSDPGRPILNAVYLDAEQEILLASDGYIAVSLPVEVDPEDVSGSIPMEAISQARKGRVLARSIICREGWCEIVHRRMKIKREPFQPFPDVGALVPSQEYDLGPDIILDADCLTRLSEALTVKKKSHPHRPIKISVHFHRNLYNGRDLNPMQAAVVKTNCDDGRYGMIMPVKTDDERPVPGAVLQEILEAAQVYEDKVIIPGGIAYEMIRRLKGGKDRQW